jgi:hypothetical protein
METYCPISCVKSGCDEPDFLQKHSSFLLTICTLLGGGLGVMLSYFLRSRCKNIRTPCCSCDREVVDLTAEDVEAAAA